MKEGLLSILANAKTAGRLGAKLLSPSKALFLLAIQSLVRVAFCPPQSSQIGVGKKCLEQ